MKEALVSVFIGSEGDAVFAPLAEVCRRNAAILGQRAADAARFNLVIVPSLPVVVFAFAVLAGAISSRMRGMPRHLRRSPVLRIALEGTAPPDCGGAPADRGHLQALKIPRSGVHFLTMIVASPWSCGASRVRSGCSVKPADTDKVPGKMICAL